MNNPYSSINFQELIQRLGPDYIQKMNDAQFEQDEHDFKALKTGLKNGTCYICGEKIDSIVEAKPCFHWLINPTVKKKLIEKFLHGGVGLIRLYGYLTWVANTERLFVNIDDTLHGVDVNKIFESTIKYKEFEWSFSLAKSDYEGHSGKKSNYPHFHFQMKKNGNVVIKFNDYHIPFSEYDLLMMAMYNQDVMVYVPGYEAGVNALKDFDASDFKGLLRRGSSMASAAFRTRTELAIPKQFEEIVRTKISELQQTTNMTVPQIVDFLNEKFGYGVEYISVNIPIDPVSKSNRK